MSAARGGGGLAPEESAVQTRRERWPALRPAALG